MQTLVQCHISHNTLSKNDLKAIAAAQTYKQPIHLIISTEANLSSMSLPTFDDIEQVTLINDIHNPQSLITYIDEYIQQHSINKFISLNSTFSKQYLPCLAALNNVGMFTDAIKIIDENTIERPMYAGDFIATVKSLDDLLLMSIRPSAFCLPQMVYDQPQTINIISIDNDKPLTQFQKTQTVNNNIDLNTADIIVTGGRGLSDPKHFELIYQLANQLNAAVGATRAAVDAGWVDNALQVGQTGKIVAPKCYIAIGVSGAIQHLAGIKDSEVIIAINNDAEAPIMNFADYAYEGDLFDVVPELINQLGK